MRRLTSIVRALILVTLIAGPVLAWRATWAAADADADADVDVDVDVDVDDVYVIGHREPAGDAGPVTTIDREAIARSGATTLDEVLQGLPAFGFQGVNGNQNSGGYGATFVDLRNLNFNRTLVLIDGRRVVLSGIQTDEAVDLANVPIALVDHIDVMPYGAAPSFGADAVAGVVNIILKQDLTGGMVSASSGASSEGGGAVEDVAASYGTAFDRSALSVSATWLRRQPVAQSERPWAADPIDTASVGPNGRLLLTRGDSASLAGNALGASGPLGPYTGYDPASASYLRAGLDRLTTNALGRYALTEHASLFLDMSYSDRNADTRLPPQALGPTGTARNPDGFIIPAANPFNPYGADITLQRVLGEVGEQETRSDNQLARVVVGIDGHLSSETAFSFSLDHGDSRTVFTTRNAVNLTRALQTVAGDSTDCAVAFGCVAADYFGVGSLSTAAAAYIRFTDVTRSHYVENVVQGNIERAFDVLATEPWHVTLGAEYRTEAGQTLPDPVVLAGNQAGGDSAITSGGYNSREAFTTVDLPLVRDVFLVRSMTANASARYVDTDLFGHFPVWQIGLSWSPVEDLSLHGRVGTARRVPAITEAFGGSTTSPLDVMDPCDGTNGLLANANVAANCRSLGLSPTFRQASALLRVANGGNANLKPEFSRSVDVGAVLMPRVARDLTLAVDYYRFRIHDAIDSLSDADPNFIPQQCFESVALSSPLCRMIVRIASGPSAGQISLINAPDQNIGAIDTSGLDVSLEYPYEVPEAGKISFDWHNTLLAHYRVQETPSSGYLEEAGTFPSLASVGSLARYKSELSMNFQADRWSASWTVRYIGGARVLGQDPATPFASAPGVFYHDLSASLRAARTTWRIGIDNVADQRPPTLIDGISNTNLNTYDVIGRYLYARVSVGFL